MGTQYTPGPWHIQQSGYRGLPHIRNADGIYVMDAPRRNDKAHAIVRQMADAHLIAAAPELLEACRKAADAIDDFGRSEYAQILRDIDAAILKATGEPR